MVGRALLAFALIAGCGDDTSEADAGPDSTVATDAADMGVDAAPIECDVPALLVAGTDASNALADAPGRCGIADYTWSRDASLGSLVDRGSARLYPLDVAVAILQSEFGLQIDPLPSRRVATRLITYVTQDRGQLVDATALVVFPTDGPAAEELDVIVLLHGTTGFTDGCGGSTDVAYQALGGFLAGYGYVVVLPDFVGLRGDGETTGFPHPYLVGEPTAHAALDAVRAALRLTPEERGQTCARPRVLAYGPSQGGHATLWVQRLAPYYARELDLVGAVAAVPPARVNQQLGRGLASNLPVTLFSVAALQLYSSWYGATEQPFIAPWQEMVPALLEASCDFDPAFPSLDLVLSPELYASVSADGIASSSPFACYFDQNDLVATDVEALDQAPVLWVTGGADSVVDTPTVRGSFATLCDAGMPAGYLECEGAGHVEGTLWALPEILEFARARFASESFTSDCVAGPATRCQGTPIDL